MLQTVSFKEVGADAPQEIKRARRQVMDLLRKSGQPVILKHRFSVKDIENGVAKLCPACWDDDLEQTRGDCPVCFRVGFVSIDDNPATWIDARGRIVSSDPGTHIHAPLFGGYGQGYLTWMIEPDSSVDVFKPDESGVMVQTQQAQGYAPWFPTLFDNDLAINVELDRDSQTVLATNERWELKMVNPNTIRGWGSLPSGISHNVWQTFEMARAPDNVGSFYNVPVDVFTTSRRIHKFAPTSRAMASSTVDAVSVSVTRMVPAASAIASVQSPPVFDNILPSPPASAAASAPTPTPIEGVSSTMSPPAATALAQVPIASLSVSQVMLPGPAAAIGNGPLLDITPNAPSAVASASAPAPSFVRSEVLTPDVFPGVASASGIPTITMPTPVASATAATSALLDTQEAGLGELGNLDLGV